MLSPLTFIAQKHWLLLFDQGITSVFLRYLILLYSVIRCLFFFFSQLHNHRQGWKQLQVQTLFQLVNYQL